MADHDGYPMKALTADSSRAPKNRRVEEGTDPPRPGLRRRPRRRLVRVRHADKGYRRKDVAAVALRGALDLLPRLTAACSRFETGGDTTGTQPFWSKPLPHASAKRPTGEYIALCGMWE